MTLWVDSRPTVNEYAGIYRKGRGSGHKAQPGVQLFIILLRSFFPYRKIARPN